MKKPLTVALLRKLYQRCERMKIRTINKSQVRGLTNISTFIEDPDVLPEDIEKMNFRTTGRTNLTTRLVHKFFITKQKGKKMKVNLEIAKICHEANRQYCIDNQLLTQAKWDELDPSMQESIVSGVAEVVADKKVTPAEMHQKWVDYKTKQGWKYALNFDAKLKTHPNLVPFSKLSKEEQAKDKLFIKTVKAEMKK